MTTPDDMSASLDPSVPEQVAEESPQPRPGLDDISRVLLRMVFVLVVVLLGTTIFLLLYLSTLNRAPRTALEREVSQWETAVVETPESSANWARLAYTYAEAGRTSEALSAVNRGEKSTGENTLVLVRADILRSAGRYTEALAAYNSAEAEIRSAEKDVRERRKRLQIYVSSDQSSLGAVYFGRGLCRRELADLKGAAEDLERAVETMPGQVNMLVALGDVYLQSGDEAKARSNYEEALRFVPDEPSALKGLAQLSGGAK